MSCCYIHGIFNCALCSTLVNITDFGADPTGKKDSTSAFQEALVDAHNQEMMKEYNAVNMMIKEATKNGLQVDVIMSFAQHVKGGSDYIEAAHCALYDWDI